MNLDLKNITCQITELNKVFNCSLAEKLNNLYIQFCNKKDDQK
ncbi:MAG: hypothetical protein NY202_03125 [Mollicutes bacterium UO1]